MKCTLFILSLWFISFDLCAQTVLSSKVIDQKTGEGIPYVNIGFISLMQGTVSDGEGEFQISYRSSEDTLSFSAIGYRRTDIVVNELIDMKEIPMIPEVYDLEEVLVDAEGYGPIQDLGIRLRKRSQSVGFGSTQLGTEIAALIPIDRPTVIYSAHFVVNHLNKEPLLLRLNIYEMKDGKPERNIVPENILIEAPSEKGEVVADLMKYDLQVNDDVLLSLEWIEGVQVEGSQGITFRARNVRKRPNMWFRNSSLSPLLPMDDLVRMQLGFFLRGQQLSGD